MTIIDYNIFPHKSCPLQKSRRVKYVYYKARYFGTSKISKILPLTMVDFKQQTRHLHLHS